MADFTNSQIEYMATQRLGRLATVDAGGQPHIVAVTFRFNTALGTVDFGGRPPVSARKYYGNIQWNPKVAFVIDDVIPPWSPRGIEVRGTATSVPTGGKQLVSVFDDEFIRITPTRIRAWGLGV